jgi:hypothetical protein
MSYPVRTGGSSFNHAQIMWITNNEFTDQIDY